jgi:hypothetical protein
MAQQGQMDVDIEGKPVTDTATKTKVHEALKKTLQDQLAAETQTRGHAPGRAAIHGMTGVSSMKRE